MIRRQVLAFRTRALLLLTCLLGSTGAGGAEFEVTNTNNVGPGSLRQAILDANGNVGSDRIVFNIAGNRVHVIRVTTSLPEITGPVDIDGYTQPGASPNTLTSADNAVLRVQLDRVSNGPANGLVISGGNSTVRGLVISRFPFGVLMQSSSNVFAGNFINTDPSGTIASGNSTGIRLQGGTCCHTIGGTSPADRNVIVANIHVSELDGPPVRDSSILGNFLGVDSTGLKAAGDFGSSSAISVRASSNLVIGGFQPGAGNVIAAGYSAVDLYGHVTNTFLLGNYVGVGADGVTPTRGGLDGGFVVSPSGDLLPKKALIKGNTIAYQRIAVAVGYDPFPFPGPSDPVMQFTISQNSFFSNQLAISLGPAGWTNDLGDADSGANGLQNFPEMFSVSFQTNTFISGILHSQPLKTYGLEFFASSAVNSNAFGDGEVYLGEATVTTASSGSAPFEIEIPGVRASYPWITATATDPDGNTSILSVPVKGRSPVLPLFHYQPVGLTVLPGSNVTFYADITGAEPIVVQWRRNGIDLADATNTTLILPDVQWETRGIYSIVASNAFGVVESQPAELVVKAEPTILMQPTNVIVFPGENATFVVQAGGTLPISYQWRRNGSDIPGASGTSLLLSNVDWIHSGVFTVVLSNSFGVIESQPVNLYVKVRPTIIQQPLSQGVVTGGTTVLSVVVTNAATLPLTWYWLRNGSPFGVITTMQHGLFYTPPAVLSNTSYRVVVSNLFGPPGVISATAALTLLTDADRDGLPDTFEDAFELDRDDPADAGLDSDGDGLSNAEEYAAGTNPRDPSNALRIDTVRANSTPAVIEFFAASNKTYTVQFKDALGSAIWLTLTNVAARPTNRTEVITDSRGVPRSYYRLVTPNHPVP